MSASDPSTIALTCELIACPSVTPDDAGTLSLLTRRLEPLGFICERMDRGETRNLWARRGHSGPLFCFAGHVDVVPPGNLTEWHSPPFTPTVRDGMLYGRGAADMKTSIAAFITAAERFIAQHPDHPGSIALLITSDEEGIATDGTVYVVETLAARGEQIDYCIVGEPTSSAALGDTIKNGRRGSLSGTLRIQGIQGHVAYPLRARNPIHMAAPALAELVATHWDDGNEFFPPTTFQISNIHAGTGANNVIPGQCELLFNFRFASVSTDEALRTRTHEILNRHQLDYTIDWHLSGAPFLTGHGPLVNSLTQAIHTVTGVTPALSTDGGTSDGRFIAKICSQVAEFGPVNSTIHKINESIAVDHIEPLSEIYRHVLDTLLTGSH